MHVTVKKEHYPLPYHDHEWAQKKYVRKFDIEYMVELTQNDLYLGEFLFNVGWTSAARITIYAFKILTGQLFPHLSNQWHGILNPIPFNCTC